jgi:hypothetical protein
VAASVPLDRERAIRDCDLIAACDRRFRTRRRGLRRWCAARAPNIMRIDKSMMELQMRRQTFHYFRGAAFSALIAAAACCGLLRTAHAESVIECRNADGSLAFQDRPCAPAQAESRVEIRPAPAPAASPDYGRTPRDDRRAATRVGSERGQARDRRDVVSYECRAANGELFYRHGACPKQVNANDAGPDRNTRKRSGNAAQTFAVSARPMPRGEACRRIASAGSIGRAGHERDDGVSTYDRNLGRDPCRYF